MKYFRIETNCTTVIEVLRVLPGLDGDLGCLVRHAADGREEWWPKAHLDHFTQGTVLSFSAALELLRAGYLLCRAAWPPEWAYLQLNLTGRNHFYLISREAKKPVPHPILLPDDILAMDWELV